MPNKFNTILFHAPTPADLLKIGETKLEQLRGIPLRSKNSDQDYQTLLSNSASSKIPTNDARIGFIAESLEETIDLLETAIKTLSDKLDEDHWSLRKGIHYRHQGVANESKIVALFSGQGSQYVGMASELCEYYHAAQAAFDALDHLFKEDNLSPLSEIVFPENTDDKEVKKAQEAKLTLTEHAQPAIGAVSVGIFKILKSMGLSADFTIGHSFGELTALWAAGVFSDDDYCLLAKARGKAMAAPDDPEFDAGSMLAIKADLNQVQEEVKSLQDIVIANLNSKEQFVLAGPKQAVLDAQSTLKERGYKVVSLPVSAAFHTALVGHAQKPFADAIRSVTINAPQTPILSNTTGELYPNDPKAIENILSDHILNPVLFKDEIEKVYEEGGRIFIECGPKNILASLVGNILNGLPHVSIAMNANAKKSSLRQLQDGILQLLITGINLKTEGRPQKD